MPPPPRDKKRRIHVLLWSSSFLLVTGATSGWQPQRYHHPLRARSQRLNPGLFMVNNQDASSSSCQPPSQPPHSPPSPPPSQLDAPPINTQTTNAASSSSSSATSSKLSRIIQGLTLIRTVAENVRARSPPSNAAPKHEETSTTVVMTTKLEFPEWMQELWDSTSGDTQRRIRRRRRKPRWIQKNLAFQGLTKWAFDMCDARGDGRINVDELYAGILLVHLNMAKYVGVTACNPLNRTEVEELFQMAAAADPLRQQTIGVQAFADIVLLSCAKITSRMVVYYSLLVVLVPVLTRRILALWQGAVGQFQTLAVRYLWNNASGGAAVTHPWAQHAWGLAEWTIQHFLSVIVVTVFIPWIFVKFNQLTAPFRTGRRRGKR